MSSAASPEPRSGPAPQEATPPAPLRDSPWDLKDFPVPLIDLSRTFEGFLDLEWLELTREVARVRFEVRENLKQPLGLLHGGIYSAVAETVASVATVRAVWEQGKSGSGLSNSASFLRPITAGTVHVSPRAAAGTTTRNGCGVTSSATIRTASAHWST